jgi:hypothetical protein
MIDVGAKSEEPYQDENHGKIILYFPSRILVHEEKLLYSLRAMVGEVGGYIGLLLGISALDVFQWIKNSPK